MMKSVILPIRSSSSLSIEGMEIGNIHDREFETNNDGWTLDRCGRARARYGREMNEMVKVSLDRTAYAGKERVFSKHVKAALWRASNFISSRPALLINQFLFAPYTL